MSIKELADNLQSAIDEKLAEFDKLQHKISEVAKQVEAMEEQMATIVFELEPVEYLVKAQNPKLETLFDSLKKVYGKENDGKSI